jgi:hypothetical protein
VSQLIAYKGCEKDVPETVKAIKYLTAKLSLLEKKQKEKRIEFN